MRVYAEGETLDRGGMLVDFGILKGALKEALAAMDHSLLNDLPPFKEGNPSAELIAKYIYDEMIRLLPGVNLSLVEVFETEKNCAGYIPDRPRH